MEVSVAHTAASGLALLKKRNFDVAIFDIRLPDENGLDLLGWPDDTIYRGSHNAHGLCVD